MTAQPVTSGHCLCGAIRYEFDGEPQMTLHCHCESCRRQTSSPVATFVMVPRSALRFTRGQPKEYASSPGVRRSFCAECGSPIAYQTDKRPDIVDLFAGTLADPATVAASCHVHAAEQLGWFEMLDDLPRYAQGSRNATPMRHGPRRT
ncbi:MAG TPA: GFA family protein [Acetobacteraceae bacterium]|jgi:hypothetical protein|nr:GFA family protein [Acetobacteraceae bacterium]